MASHGRHNPTPNRSSSSHPDDVVGTSSAAHPAPTPAPTPILKSSASSSSSIFSSLSLNDVDGGGGSHTSCIGDGGCGSRKRRALSSVDFAKEVAVIMESKIEEEEETETDVGEEEEEDVSFCLDRDGEEAKAPPSSVSRVGAKIRRLNLTDDDEGDGGGGGDGGNDPDTNAKQRRRPIDAAVRLQDPEGCDPVDDVSPRDVVNFPSFANFDSPSHEAKRGAGRGGGVGMDNGGEEFNHDHIPPARSPPTSAFELPQIPRSTARKAKAHHRRRILDDSNDDDDRMSSSPPPPRGLRMLGRANSFMQMFGISGGLVSDIIVEGEEGIGGGGGGSGGGSHGSSKRRNDLYDDFIRKPDSSVEDDVGLAMPSPKRPIRHNNHRRYTPASPPDDDGGAPTSSFSRFVSDFEVVGTLGNGSFGSVYSVRNRTDRRLYAIKAAKREARGTSDRDRMLQEVYALSALSDKACVSSMHIVRYHQAWMEGNRLYIQTELCDGTLLGQMRGAGIDERGRYKLLREMLLALDLVHKTGMIHLDIKPENIFIKNGHYKLGDFGLVSKIENHNDVEEGDSRYMSMELLLGELDDLTKSDIFSLGATMYEICLGRPENLPENGQEWQDIRHGKLLPMPNTAIELQMIVWEMMAPEWITRPSADKLLKRRQLLSDEQQQLIVERNKVNVANMALDAQKERFKALSPRKFHRSNTIC